MGMEKYEVAISYLKKLEEFAEEDLLLLRIMYHKLGTCSAFLKKYDDAVQYFQDALALCDGNGELDQGYVYVDLSTTYHVMGMDDKAFFYGNLAREFEEGFCDEGLSSYVHTLDIFLE